MAAPADGSLRRLSGAVSDKKDDLADTPLLVLIHGTGPQEHCADGADLEPVNFGIDPKRNWDQGDLWWQSDSSLCRRLAERIRTKDGHSLTEAGLVFRLKWDGQNQETARDAAADVFESVFERYGPRRIHVIAHSHGGNVVRTAIEQLARRKLDITRIGSVVSMGTPFFEYARSAWLTSVVTRAALAGLFLWLNYLLVSAHEAAGGFTAVGPREWVLFPAAMVCSLLTIVMAYLLIKRLLDRPRKGRKTGPPIRWLNLCSQSDEAIQLLASLNKSIRMLSRSAGERPPRGLAIFLLFVALGLSLTVLSVAIHYFGLPVSEEDSIVAVACLALGYALYRLLLIIRQWLLTGTTTLLDSVIIRRLRAIAFGDNDGDGIKAVRKFPWDGYDKAYVELSDDMEAEIEARISAATTGMWAKIRKAIKPDASFLDTNFGYLIDEVLTGDELAHTIYYRIDGFVDLIADQLVLSEDYVRHEVTLAS